MTSLTTFIPTLTEGIDWSIRATLVFAAAGLASLVLRNRSAATRHLVWSTVMLGALLLPLVKWSLPGWNLPAWSTAVEANGKSGPWLAFYRDDSATSSAVTDLAASPVHGPVFDGIATQSVAKNPATQSAAIAESLPVLASSLSLLLVAWGLGVGTMLMVVLTGALSLWRVRRTSQPLPPEMAREIAHLTRNLGLRRRVDGRLSASRTIPMTWGALRPVVLLPAEAVGWSRDRRRMVLLHELAHVRRWDYVIQLLGQISRAVHWFNPMAWWALHQLRLEQERACDDFVLNAGESAADYATELVTVTARLPRFCLDSAVALAIRSFARIEQRLLAILDGSRDRRPLGAVCGTTWIVLLAVGISLVAVPRWPGVQAEEQKAASTQAPTAPSKSATEPATKQNAVPPPPVDSDPTLAKIRDLIRRQSAGEVDSKRLTEAAIKGMLDSLHDPHSELLSQDAFREFQIQQQGQIVGIGVQLEKEQDAIVVVATLPNSPAVKAGLKPHDVILSVGGSKVSDLKGAVSAIRGPKGSDVVLQIRRDGRNLDLTVTRDVVSIGSVRGLALDAEGKWRYELDAATKLSYVQIAEFNQRTVTDLETALTQLHDQGLKGLVIDLRGCPGGLLETSVKVTSLFLKKGLVATIRGRQQSEQKFEADGTGKYTDLPLVVLIDDQTASAAEIFASALQDHQRAILLGERTFGKGSVQTLIPVSELDTSLKLTTAQMHRANGASLHRAKDSTTWGVDPNDGYFVPLTAEQRLAFRERRAQRDQFGALKLLQPVTVEQIVSELADPVLAAAFQTMSAKLTTGEFTSSGRPLAEMKAQLADRDALRAERDQLLEKLQQIDRQLGNPR